MSFVIQGDETLSFATLGGLREAIASRLDRTFEESDLNDFVYLAGLELERVLVAPYREYVDTLTVAAQAVDLPTDFKALRSLTLLTDPRRNLEQVSPAALDAGWAENVAGLPVAFAIIADQLWFAPAPEETYSARIVYTQAITPLTDGTPSNWVLEKHADAYFYGALVQAADFIADQSRIGLYRQAFDNVVAQINEEARRYRYGASPVRIRAAVVV